MIQLTAGRVKLAEYARNLHVVVAPPGVTLQDAMKPDFWAHVAMGFKNWDRIEIRAEDETWWADLIVVAASRLSLDVALINEVALSGRSATPMETLPATLDVNYGGPVHKHRVIRKSDGAVLAHGLSKRDAEAWARDYAAAGA